MSPIRTPYFSAGLPTISSDGLFEYAGALSYESTSRQLVPPSAFEDLYVLYVSCSS